MGERRKSAERENPQGQAGAPQPENDANPAAEAQAAVEQASITAEEFAALQAELEKTRSQASEYSDGWQRERADFSNYKKRIERDQALTFQNTVGEIARKFLPILDDMELAFKNRPAGGDGAAWADGIELIYRKFQSILEAEGITRMPAEQEHFDPTRHEAITHEDSPDHESGQIIEVVRPGYLQGERVLRPALVRVAR